MASKPADPERAEAFKALVAHYFDLYRQAFHGESPNFTAKDGNLLKRLITQHGKVLVGDRLKLFMGWGDPWIQEQGYSIGVFFSSWNRLAAHARRQAPQTVSTCQHTPKCTSAVACGHRRLREMEAGY